MNDFTGNPRNCDVNASMTEKGAGEDGKKKTQHLWHPLTVVVTRQNDLPFTMIFVRYFSHNLRFFFLILCTMLYNVGYRNIMKISIIWTETLTWATPQRQMFHRTVALWAEVLHRTSTFTCCCSGDFLKKRLHTWSCTCAVAMTPFSPTLTFCVQRLLRCFYYTSKNLRTLWTLKTTKTIMNSNKS